MAIKAWLLSAVVASVSLAGQTSSPAGATRPDPPGTIDGARNSSAIPDSVAYLMLFRAVADRPGAVPLEARVDLLRQAGLDNSEAREVINAATEFEQQTRPLDLEASAVKDQNWPSPSPQAIEVLRALEGRRQAILLGAVASLAARIGSASNALQAYIESSVKPRIKMAPSRIAGGTSHH